MAVTAIIGAVVAIAGVVNSIDDAGKRREVQANLSLLTEKQQIELAQEMAKTQNMNERIKMLTDVVQAAKDKEAARQQQATNLQWILIAVVGVAALGIVAWYMKPAKK